MGEIISKLVEHSILDQTNQLYFRRNEIQLISRGEGGGYMTPLCFQGKESVLPNFFCTPKELLKIGQKKKKLGLYLKKQKNGSRFRISE